ncbi:hypothetical protein PORCRE_476 [Porphyromonas crevioricanis JCM 15906]|uniref:Uncharacterized protein n=1 Tax=Porphyromonas crevioricanis JCM 15906 TaxID=1305617 RepID=T1DQI8_9PORP|nr:hypothetical protein PORCRE_476 [Porphyromonas crevioricanis JCM 15906]
MTRPIKGYSRPNYTTLLLKTKNPQGSEAGAWVIHSSM